jgi:alpha-ketoglutarate-dependent taurine dioxygenase
LRLSAEPSLPLRIVAGFRGEPSMASFTITSLTEWRTGDWVLWDNRSVMHQANPDYDMRERRYLYRLLLKGETPV